MCMRQMEGKCSGIFAIIVLLNSLVFRHSHLMPVVHMALPAQTLLQTVQMVVQTAKISGHAGLNSANNGTAGT